MPSSMILRLASGIASRPLIAGEAVNICSDLACFFRRLERVGYLVLEFIEDLFGEIIFYLSVSGHRLTDTGIWILIPIVTTAVANEGATELLDLSNQIGSFHAIGSSETLRTPGMCPPVRSS